MNFPILFLNLLVLFATSLKVSSALSSFEAFLTLTQDEKEALDKFKALVSDRLPHDYMKTDIFLIAWLREVDFDIPAAEEFLMSMIRWREENKMDEILKEDFSDFDEEFRGYVEGCDKEGRPVISIPVGDWDIRKMLVSGKLERLKKYVNKILEEVVTRLRQMQADGQNVAQGWIILDLNNVNIVQHGCLACISFYINLIVVLQTRYPGYIYRIMAINTPEFAIPLYNTYKHIGAPKLVSLLRIHGKNKKQWQKELLYEIDETQLTQRYGGVRLEALDSQEFRLLNKTLRCTDNWDELFYE